MSQNLRDQLDGLSDLKDAHHLWAAPHQTERGSPGGGLLLGVEQQVHAAEIEEGGRGQVKDQGRAATVGVE